MNKYGIDNFECSLVKETDNPNQDEMFYIQEFDTYHNGYNETLGGDGASYLELPEMEICNFYLKHKNIQLAMSHFGHDRLTIKKILYKNNIPLLTPSEVSRLSHSQPVAQIDPKTNEIVCIFASVAEAEKATGNGRHIGSVCKGKRATTKGYKWQYIADIL